MTSPENFWIGSKEETSFCAGTKYHGLRHRLRKMPVLDEKMSSFLRVGLKNLPDGQVSRRKFRAFLKFLCEVLWVLRKFKAFLCGKG